MASECPRHLFAFWTGDNRMSENRRRSLGSFALTGLEPVLVDSANLGQWVAPERPLHRAYDLLSAVHRSDYLRPYFMYHHGGGYADIKPQTGSWLPTVERLQASRRLIGAGYREIRGGVVNLDRSLVAGGAFILSERVHPRTARAATNVMRALRPLLIGNGAFYFKPRTGYARRWLNEVERRLDLLLPELKRNPPSNPRDRSLSGSGYPVPWAFLMGDVNAPLSLIHAPRLLRTLPRPVFEDYE